MAMDTGLIFHPYMRPERTARETFDWGVQSAIAADQCGFDSMMISEHQTQRWENIPSPELIMAASARETNNIKFAPVSHILPHHNPAKLANSVGWLSQILEGRYFMGIGAGAYPQAAYMMGIKNNDDNAFLNKMLRESLDIIERVWKREPFFYEGEFWNAGFPEELHGDDADDQHKLADFSPWGGSLEIAVTGFSFKSASLKFAGERGFRPMSIYSGLAALKSHWEQYAEAALANGHTPDRSRYHVSQTVFCADTDKEAKREVMEGPIGYCFERYLIPIWKRFGLIDSFAKDVPGTDPSDIDLEWIVDNVFVVGSPDTVTEKLNSLFEFTGGWGTLQIESHDYLDDPSPWFQSLELIAKEVAPRVSLPITHTA